MMQKDDMRTMILIVTGLIAFGQWTASAESKVDFAKDIQPILEKSCLECHGPEKQKGKLRLDSQAALSLGGKDGAVLVPGKADESDLYRRITLPAGNDDVMPNKGDLLTKAQTDLIRDWINQGAGWPAGLVVGSGVKPAKKTEATSSPSTESTPPSTPVLPDYKPSAAEKKAFEQLEAMGLPVNPIAMNLNWRSCNLSLHGSQDLGKTLPLLKEVLGLVDLNLGGTKIKDSDLASIKGLINLDHLHLENTPVTDAGLASLKGLTKLNYLNLYGTQVTDAGLAHLKGLTNLQHLYLWQTKTTPAGVEDLRKSLPGVDISTGVEFKEIAKADETKDAKKEEKKEEKK